VPLLQKCCKFLKTVKPLRRKGLGGFLGAFPKTGLPGADGKSHKMLNVANLQQDL